MKLKNVNYWQLIPKSLILLFLVLAPHSFGYSFHHYYHVLGFMTLPFVIGLIPVLFNVESLWKWAAFAVGTIVTVVWVIFNIPTRTNIVYMGEDGFRPLDKNNSNFVFTLTKEDKKSLDDSSQIVFMNPNCETCRDTIPTLQELSGKNQTAIVYVDVLTDFGREYVKHFPEIEKVPTAYNRVTGETLRLGFHTDNGTKVLKENIEKIAESAK